MRTLELKDLWLIERLQNTATPGHQTSPWLRAGPRPSSRMMTGPATRRATTAVRIMDQVDAERQNGAICHLARRLDQSPETVGSLWQRLDPRTVFCPYRLPNLTGLRPRPRRSLCKNEKLTTPLPTIATSRQFQPEGRLDCITRTAGRPVQSRCR